METSKKGTGLLCAEDSHKPIPLDNLCEDCKKNKLRYRKKERYICRYCWDRDEYPNLMGKTDEEIDTLREENLKKNDKQYSIINTSNIGFRNQT